MSVGNISGLPFQNEYLTAQKISTEKKKQTNVFSGNEGLDSKLNEFSQSYQQKGSIFKLEDTKTNMAEEGYMGKLTDEKWAESKYTYEKDNVERLGLTNLSLENAAAKTALNLKNYQEKINTANKEMTGINEKINADTKEMDSILKIFADEQKSSDVKDSAKESYDNSLIKGNTLNNSLTALNNNKTKILGTISSTQEKKDNVSNVISSLTSRKASISQQRTSLESRKSSISNGINSINDRISGLKARKASANAQSNATKHEANDQNVQQNEGTVAADNTVLTNEQTDANIDSEIQALEAELAAKASEQDQIDVEIEAKKADEAQLDGNIEASQAQETELADEIADNENKIPDIDNKISAKQDEITVNEIVIADRKSVYNKASEAHNADVQRKSSVQARYNALNAELNALRDNRDKNDKNVGDLKNMQNYLGALLEGQGDAKSGTKADLEIAEKKKDAQYKDLQLKTGIAENSRVSLFAQKDVASKAKGDLKSVSQEIEKYNNIFANIA